MGQAGAALGAAAGQHLAAIAGGHTLAEAVLLGALALFGLIGTKHGGHLLSLDFKPALPAQQQPCYRLRSAVLAALTGRRGNGQKGPCSKRYVHHYSG